MAASYSSLVGLTVGGKYEVRRVLGIGGMGVVCEAVHIDLGKKVAIKLIDKSMKESELIVARFKREARALGQIDSEHIVEVFDVGADERVGLYMVMEFLKGEDLQSRLERERDKRLDVTTGVMVGHQMAQGLEKAHASGVIHRDLKPANVFLTARDNGGLLVKLLDFGVSKVLNEVGGARITGSGAPIGTPLYMSPEQAEGKDDTDGRADIWSLGAVLYEALAGVPPFADRGSYHGTIVGILTSRPKLLHDAAPWVPAPLASVIDAMLVHDRTARIKDASTVTKRLLEAYPQVLPDGTGRHTAVIVQAVHSVDAEGDTEIFSSQGYEEAKRASIADHGDDHDGDQTIRQSFTDEDNPKGTVRLASPSSLFPDAFVTGAATPVEMKESMPPPSPLVSGIARRDGPAHRTDPMPWPTGATSSASGVAMPQTPAVLEPIAHAALEPAPDTQRDAQLALRAERRRYLTLFAVAAIVGAFSVAGFMMGRREKRTASPTAPAAMTSAPAPILSAAPSAMTELVALPPAVSASAEPPVASASASTSASVAPPRPKKKPKPKPPADDPKPESSAPATSE